MGGCEEERLPLMFELVCILIFFAWTTYQMGKRRG